MSPTPTTLVIRTQHPWLRRVWWGLAIALAPLGLYLTYELGRFDGGYDRISAGQERREQEVATERLEKANAELRGKLAEFETGRVSQQQEREELARTVTDLQTQVARQQQDLQFYRGIVSQTVGAPNVKVQRFQIVNGSAARRFKLRLVLVQARTESVASGTVALAVEGSERGKAVTYNLPRLTADARAQVPFSFRYFQDLDQEIVLPEGFQPARVNVEVRASGRASSPATQSFNWAVQST
jgi:uncharacterized FlaG/YvyC family protein